MDDGYTSRVGLHFGGSVNVESTRHKSWDELDCEACFALAHGDETDGYNFLADAGIEFERLLTTPDADHNRIFHSLNQLAGKCKDLLGSAQSKRGEVLEQLGHFLIRIERASDAELLFGQALELRHGADDDLLTLRLGLFNAYIYQGKYASAERLWRRSSRVSHRSRREMAAHGSPPRTQLCGVAPNSPATAIRRG
jgi:tetratricopeptide (TPR) repeat protein